jgi:hypothetical protein
VFVGMEGSSKCAGVELLFPSPACHVQMRMLLHRG